MPGSFNAKMRLRVPQNAVHFLTKKRLGFQGLCSMEIRSEEMKYPLCKFPDVKAHMFCELGVVCCYPTSVRIRFLRFQT